MKKPVMCVVQTHAQADLLVRDLKRSAFSDAQISVLFAHTPDTTQSPQAKTSSATAGTVAGAGSGVAIGGTLGVLAGLGVLVIPGAGPFLAAGPILAGLSGALAGAGVGGTTGGLIGLGIPEDEAKRYDRELKRGQVLVSVHPTSLEERSRAEAIIAAATRTPLPPDVVASR
jgi:hypothetical protein